MIIIDGVHMVSTESEDELHAFARKINLERQLKVMLEKEVQP